MAKKKKKRATRGMAASVQPSFNLAGSPDRGRARIHELGDVLGRTWGTHTAMPLSVAPIANIQRMPIGILEFDFRTGGGLVLGRNNRIKGSKDTLKSTMCLRALRAAQHTCRECKWPIVTDPTTGLMNCRCPEHRFWVANEEDYGWLPQDAAVKLFYGHLPEGAEVKNVKGVGRVPVLKCEPPPHLKGKKGINVREIPFAETYRCEPMRCVFVDSEGTIDLKWAQANGVDPALVLLVGGKWGEQCLESVERTMLTHEFDFIVVDSTSMMETRHTLEEKKLGDHAKVAGKAKLMGDFIKRVVAAQAEEGLASRYRPTLLTTSHLTTKGISGFKARAYLGATDGRVYDHGIAMDIQMKAERFVFDATKQKAVYGVFNFKIDKNHCGGAGSTKTSGEIKFWLVETPDHPVGDSNDMATVMGYSRQFGSGFIEEGTGAAKLTLYSDYVEDGWQRFGTIKACTQYLNEHPSVYADLRRRVLDKLIEDRATLTVVATEEVAETA